MGGRGGRASGRPRRSGRLVGLAAALAVAAAATGCVPGYSGNAAGPKVAVIGDSIMSFAGGAVHVRLDPTYAVSVTADGGFTIAAELGKAGEYNGTNPDVAVIELAANDAYQAVGDVTAPPPTPAHVAETLAASGDNLRQMLRTLAVPRCVVVVDVGTVTFNRAYNDWAAAWNTQVLPVIAKEDARVRIAGWDKAMKDYYALPDPKDPLTEDVIHPAPTGQKLLADIIGAQVDACAGAAHT